MKDDKSLLYACVINDDALIRQRLEHATPAQLKKRTRQNGTPLHAAALNQNKKAVDLLLEHGANLEACDFLGNNAMLACVEAGLLDMAKYLIEKGSDVHKKGCQNRAALSMLICYSWNRAFAQYLLERGVNINQTARDRESLLVTAASFGNSDAIDFLLEQGIDRTCLHKALCWAIIHNEVEAARLLLDHGADLNEMYAACKGIEKGLYHHVAAGENHIGMITLLIQAGVDFTAVPPRAVVVGLDRTKRSPVEYARERLQNWPGADYIADNIALIEQA